MSREAEELLPRNRFAGNDGFCGNLLDARVFGDAWFLVGFHVFRPVSLVLFCSVKIYGKYLLMGIGWNHD